MAKKGRKPKYIDVLTPEMLDVISQWRRDGLTEQEIAKNLHISLSTLQAWKKEIPQFSDILKKGASEALAQVENALFKSAVGYWVKEETKTVNCEGEEETKTVEKYVPPNVASMVFYLKNRSRGKWVDNPNFDASEETLKKLEDVLNNFGGNV